MAKRCGAVAVHDPAALHDGRWSVSGRRRCTATAQASPGRRRRRRFPIDQGAETGQVWRGKGAARADLQPVPAEVAVDRDAGVGIGRSARASQSTLQISPGATSCFRPARDWTRTSHIIRSRRRAWRFIKAMSSRSFCPSGYPPFFEIVLDPLRHLVRRTQRGAQVVADEIDDLVEICPFGAGRHGVGSGICPGDRHGLTSLAGWPVASVEHLTSD